MGILDFFKLKRFKLYDDFFGELRFMDVKEPHKNYFEGWRTFQPIGKAIEIAITSELSGPTQSQKEFFIWVEHHFHELLVNIAPIVQGEFQKWESDFVVSNFKVDFEPVYIAIPACKQHPIEWEISFDSKDESQITYTVTIEMIGEQPISIYIGS